MQEEQKSPSKPMQLWQQALKVVKGDNTEQLVEQFTSEMTLVAEGLVEDQSRLRAEVERMARRQDRGEQRLESEIHVLEKSLLEMQRDTDARLSDLSRRLTQLEGKRRIRQRNERDWLSRVTVLAAIIAGAWVIVTVLNLFR